jgi:hypothetical protein
MKKLLVSFGIGVLLAFVGAVGAMADGGGYLAREAVREYRDGMFADIGEGDWFAPYVRSAYEYGLMSGRADDTFAPDGTLTAAEAVALAVSLHMAYYDKELAFAPQTGEHWYGAYTDAAVRWGITAPLRDYRAPASRALVAQLVYSALPPEAYEPQNHIADYCIPDVSPAERYGEAVYALYRAGVLTGDGPYGQFRPDDTVTRAQAAAIAARAANPVYRARVSRPDSLSPRDIYALWSDAVIQLDTYDEIHTHIRTGSAFFISSTGLAVTNLHVLDYSDYAVATLADGTQRKVIGVVARDAQANIAILAIEGEGYKHLKLADSADIVAGAPAYVISSPYGYTNSLTEGVIAKPLRELDEQGFVQFTAHISFGSGGAPLLDSRGFVVGIASSSFSGAQSLNLAVPINALTTGPLAGLTTVYEY